MSDNPTYRKAATWYPNVMQEMVLAIVAELTNADIPIASARFYQELAHRAEEIVTEAIAEAIAARDHETEVVMANIRRARQLLERLGDNLFLATEQANDPILSRLTAYLLLEGSDGYNELNYHQAWGAHPNPDWGAIWGIKQKVRDFTPAFIFKACMRGEIRLLAVECHAPNRDLPDDLHERVRARTIVISSVPIIAFAPAEIEADAHGCVEEIGHALSILAQELLSMHGLDAPPRLDFRPR